MNNYDKYILQLLRKAQDQDKKIEELEVALTRILKEKK